MLTGLHRYRSPCDDERPQPRLLVFSCVAKVSPRLHVKIRLTRFNMCMSTYHLNRADTRRNAGITKTLQRLATPGAGTIPPYYNLIIVSTARIEDERFDKS
jgi:hypothetical protein